VNNSNNDHNNHNKIIYNYDVNNKSYPFNKTFNLFVYKAPEIIKILLKIFHKAIFIFNLHYAHFIFPFTSITNTILCINIVYPVYLANLVIILVQGIIHSATFKEIFCSYIKVVIINFYSILLNTVNISDLGQCR